MSADMAKALAAAHHLSAGPGSRPANPLPWALLFPGTGSLRPGCLSIDVSPDPGSAIDPLRHGRSGQWTRACVGRSLFLLRVEPGPGATARSSSRSRAGSGRLRAGAWSEAAATAIRTSFTPWAGDVPRRNTRRWRSRSVAAARPGSPVSPSPWPHDRTSASGGPRHQRTAASSFGPGGGRLRHKDGGST